MSGLSGSFGALIGKLHYSVGAFTGWDWLASKLFPARWLRLRVARKIARAVGPQRDDLRVTFTLPDAPLVVWEIGKSGEVFPAWQRQPTSPAPSPEPPRAA